MSNTFKSLPTIKNLLIQTKIEDNVEDIPQVITGVYYDDFDIIKVNNIILKRFKLLKKKTLHTLKDQLKEEIKKLDTCTSIVNQKYIQRNIDEYRNQINKIQSNELVNEYLSLTSNLIEQYKKLRKYTKTITIDNKLSVCNDNNDEDTERQLIIYQYLEIARRYITVNVVRKMDNKIQCDNCGYEFNVDEYNDLVLTCNKCGTDRQLITKLTINKPSTSTMVKNKYDDRDNFRKAIMIFQGKYPIKIPSDLFPKLDKYFTSYNLNTSDYIKSLPLDSNGRKDNTSKELMYKALSSIDYSEFYKHINLLCHLYWGWLLPDISNLEESLMIDYELSQKVIIKIVKNRKSCIGREFRLYQLLRRHGFQCSPRDFRIIKTADILELYKSLWHSVCDELKWEFFPV